MKGKIKLFALMMVLIAAFSICAIIDDSEDSDAYTTVSSGDIVVIGNQYLTSHTSDNNITRMWLDSVSNATVYTDSSYNTTVSAGSDFNSYSGHTKNLYFIPSGSNVSIVVKYKQSGSWFDDTYTWSVSFTGVNQYTVTLIAGTGSEVKFQGDENWSTSSVSKTVNAGTSVTAIGTYLTGYSWTGWSDGTTNNFYTFTVNSNITLTAQSTPAVITITKNTSGSGSGTISGPSSVNYGSSATFTQSANTGSTFTKWIVVDDNTTEYTTSSLTITPTVNTTVTAVFSSNSYSVTVYKGNWASFYWYNGNDTTRYTTSSHTYTVYYGQTFDIDWNGSSSTSGSGTDYTYVTTYDSSNNYMARSMYGTSIGDSVTISGAGSYYPANSMGSSTTYTYNYRITYDANGGSGAPSDTVTTSTSTGSSPIAATKSITLPSTTPTRTDYNFLGWATSSSAVTPTYSAGSTYTFNYGTTELFAVWGSTQLTVTLIPDTGTKVKFQEDSGWSTSTISKTVAAGTSVTVVGTYQPGYTWVGWSDGTSNSIYTFTVNSNVTLTATATVRVIDITLNTSGSGSGTISGPTSVNYNTSATYTQSANTGSTFTKWIVVDDNTTEYSTSSLTITPTVNTTVTAVFTLDYYTVTFVSSDPTYGTISPNTLSVGYGTTYHQDSSNSNKLVFGTDLVTATPSASTTLNAYSFDSWSSSSGTITGPTTITANFTSSVIGYTVTLIPGIGTEVKFQNDANWSTTTISKEVSTGTSITVIGTYLPGYSWTGWSDGTTSSFYTFTVNSDVTLTAQSDVRIIQVTLNTSGSGSGTISGPTSVNYGDSATYTQSANTGSTFTKWIVVDDNTTEYTTSSITISPTVNTTVTAVFTLDQYTVSIVSSNTDYGTVSPSTLTVSYGTSFEEVSNNTLQMKIGLDIVTATPTTATQQYAYVLDSWSPSSGTITGPTTITANFIRTVNEFTVTLIPDTGTQVKFNGEGSWSTATITKTVTYGTSVTAVGTYLPGYTWTGWDDGTQDNFYTFTVTNNKTLTATATERIIQVTLNTSGSGSGTISGPTSVNYNTSATYTQSANTGSTFTKWIVVDDNVTEYTTPSITISPIVNTTVTAVFTLNYYTVTFVSSDPTYGTISPNTLSVGHGTSFEQLSSDPNKMKFGLDIVTATPTATTQQYTYALDSWSPSSGTITGPITITANFTRTVNEYTITSGAAAITGSTVSLYAPGYPVQTETYGVGSNTGISLTVPYGTVVTLTASEIEGYRFVYWTEPLFESTEEDNPLSITVMQNEEFYPEYVILPANNVWWDNGYFNGSVEIAFDFTNHSNMIHSIEIPMFSYDGIEDDEDEIDEFSENGYSLLITNSYNANITCSVIKPNNQVVTYTPYNNGNWNQYVLKIDVQNGTISFIGIEAKKGTDFSFLTYDEIFEKVIFDISDNVKNMAISKIYHEDNGSRDHPHFQVQATTTYLKTYGFVMVDPTLNIYDRFPNYDNLRLNLYSFAYYGDSITINHHTFDMDGSIISGFWYLPKDSPIYENGQIVGYTSENVISEQGVVGSIELKPTLNNVYITWTNINTGGAEDRVCYLTFVNDNMTINMGNFETGDLTISFGGVWYFTTAIYEPYIGYETAYTMDWNSPFNLDKDAFILVFIGIAILCFLVMNLFYRPGILDYLIVGLTGLIAYILL